MHQDDGRPNGEESPTPRGALHEELVHHLPFSVSAVAIGLTIAGIICFLTPGLQVPLPESEAPGEHAHVHGVDRLSDEAAGHQHDGHDNPYQPLFHLFHPVHMLFSAAATTAMFWRYERRVWKAVVVGLIGAVGVCGLSDIVIPHVSLAILGKTVPWHICAVEHPEMVFSFAAIGVIIGLAAAASVSRSTFFSHSLHVFSSTMASIFYLIGPFGHLEWIDSVGVVFLFVIVAVMVPCCLSDIVFPMFLAKGAKGQYRHDEQSCCT